MSLADRVNGALKRVPAWPIYIVGAMPPLWLLWQGATGGLGPEPIGALEKELGEIALQAIVAVLAVTPLRRFTGISLLKFRRAMGLVAFFWALSHFLVWAVLDMGLFWRQAIEDIVKRPFVTIGMAALLLLVPLALTSNDRSVRRMGAAAWKRLHYLTYPAAILAAIHFVWLTKTWQIEPMIYLGAILVLLTLRLIPRARPASPAGGQTAAG
jgi:sulfoxide reductase heme-binding subunit YedZ